MNSIEDVCRRYSCKVTEIFTAGHVCPAVYKVQCRDGEPKVIKIGNTIATIQEIVKNLEGYEMLRKIGLGHVCPRIYTVEVGAESAVVIMEYCGKDFYTSLETSSNPEAMFQELDLQLRNG